MGSASKITIIKETNLSLSSEMYNSSLNKRSLTPLCYVESLLESERCVLQQKQRTILHGIKLICRSVIAIPNLAALDEVRRFVCYVFERELPQLSGCSRLSWGDVVAMLPYQLQPLVGPYCWKLAGRPVEQVTSFLDELIEELEERMSFVAEFSQSQAYKRFLVCKGEMEEVSVQEFKQTKGKVIRDGNSFFKYVKPERAQPQGAVMDILAGISKSLSILQIIGGNGTPSLAVPDLVPVARLVLSLARLRLESIELVDVAGICLDLYDTICRPATSRAQSLDALTWGFLSLSMPPSVYEAFKRMNVFSATKFLDDASMMSSIVDTIIDFLKACIDYAPEAWRPTLEALMDKIPLGSRFTTLHKLDRLLKRVQKDHRLLLSNTIRQEAKDIALLIEKAEFVEWERRSLYVKNLVSDYKHLMKAVTSYDATRRIEPVCIAFEGPPKCGKSRTLNNLIDVMRQHPTSPKSIYPHTVRNIKDGKNFYDMYNNEDWFVMDDLGQQGNNQFRSLINWVSEVKYPLDCASADLKDTKFFNSEMIAFTTNKFMSLSSFTKDDCISSPEALFRRAYVFDFEQVRSVGDHFKGTVVFRMFHTGDDEDPQARWVERFPCENPLNLPTRFSMGTSRAKYLKWYRQVCEMLVDSRRKYKESGEVTQEELADIYADDVESNRRYLYEPFTDDEADDEFVEAQGLISFSPEGVDWGEDSRGYMNMLSELLYENYNSSSIKYGVAATALLGLAVALYYCLRRKPEEKGFTHSVIDDVLEHLRDLEIDCAPSTVVTAISKASKFVIVHGEKREHGIALMSGHMAVVPFHMARGVTHLTVFADSAGTQRVWDKLPARVVWESEPEDVTVLCVDKNIQTSFKNIAHLISFSAKANTFVATSSVIPLQTYLRPSRGVQYSNMTPSKMWVNTLQAKRSVKYAFGKVGLCGAVVVDKTSGVVGMHVAGTVDGQSGFSALWSDVLVDTLQRLLAQDTEYYLDIEVSDKSLDISGAKFKSQWCASAPTKTKIVPSPLFGIMPNTKAPPNFTANGPHTIKDLAKKSMIECGSVPIKHLAFAKKWVASQVSPFKKITMEEVVKGNASLAGLNKKSANGVGFEREKDVYVNFEKGDLTPLGKSLYDKMRHGIISGKLDVKDVLWKECLKDELRAPNKVDAPRTFRCCNVIMQVLLKELTGNLVAQVMANKWENGIMIGINPLKDFKKIYANLSRHKYKWGGDFPKYDGRIPADLHHAVVEEMVKKFDGTDEDRKILAFLLHNMAHSLVVIGDDLFLMSHSMPSGSFLTALLNSFYNRCITACWYADLCQNKGVEPTLSEFIAQISDYVYGDDKAVGSSVDGGDMLSMAAYVRSIGMEMSTASKGEVTRPSEEWNEITFLKREFRYDWRFGTILCPLDLNTICSTLSWVDSSKDCDVVMHGKLDAFQREMFLHPTRYEAMMDILREGLEMRGIEHVFRTEKELYAMVMDGDYDFYQGSYSYKYN